MPEEQIKQFIMVIVVVVGRAQHCGINQIGLGWSCERTEMGGGLMVEEVTVNLIER